MIRAWHVPGIAKWCSCFRFFSFHHAVELEMVRQLDAPRHNHYCIVKRLVHMMGRSVPEWCKQDDTMKPFHCLGIARVAETYTDSPGT